MQQQTQLKRGVRLYDRSNPADTKVSENGGIEGAIGTRKEISLQPVVETMVKPLCPCSPWRFTGVQRSSCSRWRSPHWNRWMHKRGLWKYGKPVLEQSAGRSCGPMEGPYTGALCCWRDAHLYSVKNCSTNEGFTLEKLMENFLLWDKPHNGKGKECGESSLSEGWTSRNKMRPQPTFLVAMCHYGGGDIENWVWSRSKKEGQGEKLYNLFYFSLPYFDLIVSRLN